MRSQLLEELLDVENVSFRVRVENDGVIEVGSYVSEAFDHLIDDLDEPSRRRAAPLWHEEPLEEAYGRAESRERDSVFVDRDLMQRRDQIEEGENSSATQLVEDFVDSGYGELSKNMLMFNFLWLIVSRIPPQFFGMMTTGLAYGEVECCMRPTARYSSKNVSICLATRGFTRGREVTGVLSGGTEIWNGRREHEPKSVSDLKNTSENSMRVSPSWVIL